MDREVDHCRCSRCKKTFRVLADEVGDHPCPYCGFERGNDDDDKEDLQGGEE